MVAGRGGPTSPSKDGTDVPASDRPVENEAAKTKPRKVDEIGGPKGPEPTRYGDWEKGGRCSDF